MAKHYTHTTSSYGNLISIKTLKLKKKTHGLKWVSVTIALSSGIQDGDTSI